MDFSRRRSVLSLLGTSFGTLCARGPRLRQVMEHYWRGSGARFAPVSTATPRALYPLRALRASALREAYLPAVIALAGIEPTRLGQIIPKTVTDQREWLKFLAAWVLQLERRRSTMGVCCVEVGRVAALMSSVKHTTAHEGQHLADYMAAMGTVAAHGLPRTWAELSEAVRAWDVALGRIGAGNTIVVSIIAHRGAESPPAYVAMGDADYSPLPNDPVVVDGFTFVPLRSPSALAEEGAAMRHCVGSYAVDVYARASFIFSVRDATGVRVATLELAPASSEVLTPNRFFCRQMEGSKHEGRRQIKFDPAVTAAVQHFVELQNARR